MKNLAKKGEAHFLKADVQGDMAICPNCGHEGKLSSYIDGCDACGAKFLVSDFETKVSGFSLEEDARQKSISNFIKAGVTVGIVAVALFPGGIARLIVLFCCHIQVCSMNDHRRFNICACLLVYPPY